MYSAIHDTMTRAQVGIAGERTAQRFFNRVGISARHPRRSKVGDLIISNNVRVEVKTSTLNKDGRYTATLYKYRNGIIEQNYRYSDYVLFQCVDGYGRIVRYMIPVTALGERSTLKINKSHNTKFAQYKI